MSRGGAAAKAVGGLAKWRARARAGSEAALAISGDPRAVAKLLGRALRRVWRSPLARRMAVAVAVAGVLVVLSVVGGAGGGTAAGVEGAPGAQFGAEPMVWAAYTVAGRVWCAPDGTVRLSGDPLPEPWTRTDWRLVAAVGGVESNHAAGRTVNAFGDVWPPVLGPTLDGTIDGLVTIPDTDHGRFDLDTRWDKAVGPMQLLPSTVVSAGVDGNADGIVDPHNLWDATATASAYLCAAATDSTPSEAVFAYNHSEVYVDAVLGGLAQIVIAGVEKGHAGRLPDDAPLPYIPSTADGGTVLGSVVEHFGGDPDAVRCSTGCSWRVEPAPGTVPEWEPLSDAGYASPVQVPGGVTASGDGTLRAAVPALGDAAWPLPTAAMPQPAGATPPLWWSHFVSTDHPGWTAHGSRTVTIPSVWAGPVYAPQRGTVNAGGGCAQVTAGGGWLWRLCGARVDDPLPSPAAGHRLGSAVGAALVVELVGPDGRGACPQSIFGLWAVGQRDTPQAIAAQIAAMIAAAEAVAETDPDLAAAYVAQAAHLEWRLYEECVA